MSRRRFKRVNYASWNRPSRRNLILSEDTYFGPSPVKTYIYARDSVNTPAYWSYYLAGGHRLPVNNYNLFVSNHSSPTYQETQYTWVGIYDANPPYALLEWRKVSGVTRTFTAPQVIGYPSNWNLGLAYDDSMMAARRSRILAKLSANKASIGEFVGEIRQTRDMFLGTAARIIRCATLLRSFKVSDAVHALGWHIPNSQLTHLSTLALQAQRKRMSGSKFLSNIWLEFHYGWEPLLSDLFGVCEVLASNIDSGTLIKTVVSRKSLNYIDQTSSRVPGVFTRSLANVQSLYKITISFKVVNPNAHLREQLGLNNPLQIAWNLLPYGYIVDWFVNVNSFLSETMATSGLEFVDGSEVFNTNSYTYHSWVVTDPGPGGPMYSYNFSVSHPTHYRFVRKVIRTKLNSFPTATLRFGSLLQGSRVPTALALLRQRFR